MRQKSANKILVIEMFCTRGFAML